MKVLLVVLSLLMAGGAAVGPPRIPSEMMPAQPPAAVPAPPVSSVDAGESATYGPYGVVWRVRTTRKEIALTFDDGPYPFYTPVLLHVLDRSRVPATFFIVGRSAQAFPELVTRIVESGDEIGNHTFNHYTLTSLRDDQIAYQIAADGALLQQFTGRPLSLFRPPHGRFNRHVVAIARELGYHTIFWSAAADDVKDIPPDLITARVLSEANPGGIVLLHSGQYRTIEALPDIIDGLRDQGYSFVTVSKLIEDGETPEPSFSR